MRIGREGSGPHPVRKDVARYAESYILRTLPMRGGFTGAATP